MRDDCNHMKNHRSVQLRGRIADRIEVERLQSTVASRILGVWMAPNRDSLVQAKKLEALTKSCANLVRSGCIKTSDAWYYYQTTIQQSLEHPLLTTASSESKCCCIKRPALQVVLYGPPKHLG
eukprot:15366859-Ditylum_brightwellii.AAC.1